METRAAAPRALCIDFAAVKNTVQVFAEWFLGPKNQNLILTFVQLHTKFGTIDENRTKLCSVVAARTQTSVIIKTGCF